MTFKCENLDDFQKAKDWINKNDVDWTIEDACSDIDTADQTMTTDGEVFSAGDFIRFSKDAGFDTSGDFDFDSIMIYGSTVNADDKTSKWPLQHKDGSEIIPAKKPSRADIAAVHKLYPQQP